MVLVVSVDSPMDPCADRNGGCQDGCSNRNGRAVCSCRAGYTLAADGRMCNCKYTCRFITFEATFRHF